MKTYSTILENLNKELILASKKAYKMHYQTPAFLKMQALYIHQAFEKFCINIGVSCDKAATFKSILEKHYKQYRMFNTKLEILFYSLPDAYNVRGIWAPSKTW